MKQLILAALSLMAPVSVFAQPATVLLTDYNALGTTHVWGPSSSAPTLCLGGYTSNDNPSGDTPYSGSGMSLIGTTGMGGRYGSSTTFAQLLFANGADRPEALLQPGGQTTTFRTGATLGRLTFTTDTVAGLIPDEDAATFELVAWDNSSCQYPTWAEASAAWSEGFIAAGKSGAFTVHDIGGEWNTPPVILPVSFNLYFVTEPSGINSDAVVVPEPSALALAGFGLLGLYAGTRTQCGDRNKARRRA